MLNRAALERAAKVLAFAASLFLIFMMLFTTVSLVLRELEIFTGEGDVDLMILAFGASFFLALPAVTLRGDHVVVDLIDHLVGRRALIWMRWIGWILVVAFLGFIFVTAITPAVDKLTFGENTMSLNINRFWLWLPLLIGLGLSTLAGLILILNRLIEGDPDIPTKYEDGV